MRSGWTNNVTLWIVLTVLWVLFAIPAGFMAMMSFFMFDAPGSETNGLTIALFWCVLVGPVFWVIGAGVPWIFRRTPYGIWLFLIPFVDLAAIVVVVILLQSLCGGSFSCH